MVTGWIKLYRELLHKPIWITSTPEQKVVLTTLLMMVNHSENEWEFKGEKYTVKPGQMITSLESIVANCGKGVTIQNVRTALKRFENYGFLTNESTNRNRLITVVNWEVYQPSENEPNKQLTSNQQATNKQLTTNKNVKNDKNEKKINNSRHKYEPCDLENANLLYKKILENNPQAKKPNLEKWASDFRLIRQIDKRTDEQVKYLIDWTQQDTFWKANILSPARLRKQFDHLVVKIKSSREAAKRKTAVLNEKEFDLTDD
ncbi:Replication protein O [Bacillus safensis]|nr:Replication protein O [Bacillus safensis]WHX77260.1 Replication protein O [Bacillus safensis]WHX84716.1 Replication protein O [Bacillus safensis]